MRSRENTSRLLITLLLLLFHYVSFGQINVSAAQTAAALAQKLAGEGVTILNPTLTCPAIANGIFRVVNSNLGLDSGIVLTTGRAVTAGSSYGINGYSSYLASTDNGVAGDIMLNPLAGQPTIDACSLEFDIIPNGDSIKFSYVFSSEEYKNAVCGPYNDAFAFFISGPGIPAGENMALVPGTNIPVTINSINNGVPGASGNIENCNSIGAGSPFTDYYIDNAAGQTLTHYGLTKVLEAKHAVAPCHTYHLKLAIADAGDPLYDSGVFLKAGSLKTANYNINAVTRPIMDTSFAYCVKGCLPGAFRVKRTQVSSEAQMIRYVTGGNAISGTDYSPLPDSVVIPANDSVANVVINGLATPANGTKTIQLYILSPYSCAGTNNIVDSALMVIFDTIHISMMTPDTIVCGNDSVLLQLNGSDLLAYSWSPDTWINNAKLKDPVVAPLSTTTYIVTASLPGGSCPPQKAVVNFTVKLTPAIEAVHNISICYNTQLSFNASTVYPNLYYNYQWSGPAGFTSTLLDPAIGHVNEQAGGIYTLTITNDTNQCRSVAAIIVAVTVPDTPKVISPAILCLNTRPTALTAQGSHLRWYSATDSTGDTLAPSPSTGELAAYDYYVTQTINSCESPGARIAVEVKKCCDGHIAIPTAFTPNDDGRNDRFRPIEDYGYYIERMYIFNRWGQIVYAGLNDGWDGKSGGKPADMGTYFYNIIFGCILGGIVERKGDVLLLR